MIPDDLILDYRAFLVRILDANTDDTPRLVFADWLDEHGRPDQAELIRVQCELRRYENPDRIATAGVDADLPPLLVAVQMTAQVCYLDRLTSRRDALIESNGREWVKSLWERWATPGFGPVTTDWWFDRGLVHTSVAFDDWFGGACTQCEGRGQVTSAHGPNFRYEDRCPRCEGTGFRPGVGRRAVREHPVGGVIFHDRAPLCAISTPGEGPCGWVRMTALPAGLVAEGGASARIVDRVFDRMVADVQRSTTRSPVLTFPTPIHARAALSRAAILDAIDYWED